jgi:hypothetical protein
MADANNKRRTKEVHGSMSRLGTDLAAHNALVPDDEPLDAIIDHVLPPFVGVTAHGVLG